jgi:hypothetical protein
MVRFGKHVFLIGTGMLRRACGGRGSTLEIQNGRFIAYYSDGQRQALLSPDAATLPAGAGHEQKREGHP